MMLCAVDVLSAVFAGRTTRTVEQGGPKPALALLCDETDARCQVLEKHVQYL